MKNAWLFVMTKSNWKKCLKSNTFGSKYKGKLKNVKRGDGVLLYIKGTRLISGTGKITKSFYQDNKRIWRDALYPYRVKFELKKPLKSLDIAAVKDKLEFISDKKKWPVHLRGGIRKIPVSDFKYISHKAVSEEIQTATEVGRFLHEKMENLLEKMEFKIIKSNYFAEGPDLIAQFVSGKQKAKILVQCKRHAVKDLNEPNPIYPSISRLIDEYSWKIQKYRGRAAILAISGFQLPKGIDARKILQKNRVAIWTDKMIDYYEDLYKKIGKYSKYQLLADLGLNIIFEKDKKVEAIKVQQNHFIFYLFTVEPEWLLKSVSVLRRIDPSIEPRSYQRLLTTYRVKREVPTFLNSNEWVLPNNIICATRGTTELVYSNGKLFLPSKIGLLWIIDGQHRLYGFANVSEPDKRIDSKIACAVLDSAVLGDKAEEEEAQIFIDLNMRAKKVPPSLLAELDVFLGRADIALRVVMRLAKIPLFKGMVKSYSESRGTISLVTFAYNQAIRELFKEKGPVFKNKSFESEESRRETEDQGFNFLRKYFNQIKKVFKKEWGNKEYALTTDKGIRGLLKLLQRTMNYYGESFNGEKMEKILKALKNSRAPIKSEDFKNKYAGEGGANDLLEIWSNYIAGNIRDFPHQTDITAFEIPNAEDYLNEFKASLRWDYRSNGVNTNLEAEVLKAIAAFMNTSGGKLYIGIDNDRKVIGLGNDYASLRNGNRDTFRVHLSNLIKASLGGHTSMYIQISFIEVESKDICILEISKSNRPVYLRKGDEEEFYIRADASSQPLNIREATIYISDHFST